MQRIEHGPQSLKCPMTQRITDQRTEQRKQQAQIGVEKRLVPFAQHHRRQHHFRHDRKDEGLDETQPTKVINRFGLRAQTSAGHKVFRTAHQPIPPSSGTKLTGPSSSWMKSPCPSPRMRINVCCWPNRPVPPARRWAELIENACGNRVAGGGEDDRIERRLVRPAQLAVVVARAQVGDTQLTKASTRLAQQLLDALHREELRHQSRQHGSLITRTRTDLQHLLRHALFRIEVSSSTSVMRATTHGCEMVWPWPIGSAVFS
jgi:hypothetical protein